MKKILAALSGGVDSAVCAALLAEQGYAVDGATMLLHDAAQAETDAARKTAEQLGIGFFVFDFRAEFEALVQTPFREVYRSGGTPNPCVLCNKTVKFGLFLEKALSMGYDGIATGHYARVVRNEAGRYLIRAAADRRKDQTYMFCQLSQEQLSHLLLPMGELTKAQAREKAAALGLASAGKSDSQDICFIPDGDYFAYLTAHGLVPQPGHFFTTDGRDLGEHRGMEAYTVGQRRGLNLACGSRVYVIGKRGADVLIGTDAELYTTRVRVDGVNWLAFDTPPAELRAQAKLRYTPNAAPCRILPGENGTAELIFDTPQRAATPGQTAVFYDGDTLLGGGTIL